MDQHPGASWSYVWDGLQYNSDGTVTEASPYAQNGKVSIWYGSSKSSGVGSGANSIIGNITSDSNGGKTATTAGGSSVTANPDGTVTTTIKIGGKTITTTTTTGGSGGTSKSGSSSGKKKTFDSGGILSGFGGIKATSADEIVIPPDIADYMLRPSASSQFKARMAELGYIYGTNKDMPGTLAGIASSRMSNDHYGDVYQYGNITLTEGQARSMSVYDLAQMSRSLSIYRNV